MVEDGTRNKAPDLQIRLEITNGLATSMGVYKAMACMLSHKRHATAHSGHAWANAQ